MKKVLLPLAILLSLYIPCAWAAEEAEAEDEKTSDKTSAYISLGDSMVLNLSSDKSRLTFLQLKADVVISDSNAEDIIKTHIPAIRHELIVLLSEQKARDMKSAKKREEIRKIATTQVQQLMLDLADNSDVTDILFSSFLVQ